MKKSRILAGLFIESVGGVSLRSCWVTAYRDSSFPSANYQMSESDGFKCEVKSCASTGLNSDAPGGNGYVHQEEKPHRQ